MAFLGRMMGATEGPKRANYGLFEVGPAERKFCQPAGGFPVGAEALFHVGIAVAAEREYPADAVEAARGPVGPAADPDLIPEVVVAEQAGGHADGGMRQTAAGGQAGGEADEVDGGGDNQAFAGNTVERRPFAGPRRRAVGEIPKKGGKFTEGGRKTFGLSA